MQSLQGQHFSHPQRKKRWWCYALPLIAFALTLVEMQAKPTTTHAATHMEQSTGALVQLSHDPYTETSTNLGVAYHQSGLEPVSSAFGPTIVTTFQVGRFQGGGSTNLGWATSADSGEHWTKGLLPSTTTYAGGLHNAISNASVAYDPAHHVWLIAYLFVDAVGDTTIPPFTTSQTAAVSRSLDGGFT